MLLFFKPAQGCINSHICKDKHEEILHFTSQGMICIAVIWKYQGGWSDVERV